DANNNLVLINYDKDITIPTQFSVSGSTGFSYFDDHVNGTLSGNLAASNTTVHVHLTYGVDVDVVNGKPLFYVADQSAVTVDPVTLSGSVKGDLAIRSLANVHAEGAVAGSLGGKVTLSDTQDGLSDHRVRASALGASASGAVNGSLALNNIQFTLHVPVLDSITFG